MLYSYSYKNTTYLKKYEHVYEICRYNCEKVKS